MDPERWRRLDALFQDALDLPAGERAGFLAEACADDESLRREVEAMLAADGGSVDDSGQTEKASAAGGDGASGVGGDAAGAGAALDRLADIVIAGVENSGFGDDEEGVEPGSIPFENLGPYRLIRELGRGGLATVYLAERDDEEFSMEVAVKVIRVGLDSPAMVERLRLERQILARLEHPNIARLVDGGTAPDGRPYFVMERIEGERIDLWCEHRGLDIRERIELFRQVCDAVQTAHGRLVLHRDIKPSNILVTGGVPKLLDFGIAKLLDAAEDQETVAPGFTTLTDTGMRLLTPEFASPEQIRGEALTTASDVYSLGVLLYLLVTGERPYDFDRARPSEIERVICEVEPKRPSARVWMRAAEGDKKTADLPTRRSLGWPRRAGGDDLDTIVREALRKEPELRYGSVARLSSDLDAYLNDLPISARPDTFSYLAGKFVRRHRVPVLGTLLLLAVLVGGVVTTSWQAQIARKAQERAELQRAEAAAQRDRAELERRRAEETTAFLTDLFDVSDPFRTEGEKQQTTARELLELGAQRIASEFDDDPLLRASLMTTIGRVYRNLALLDDGDALLSEALELRRKALADDSAGPVLESLSDVADLRLDQERYREAGEILEGLVSERRRRGDPQALALALEDLSLAKRGLDLPQEAEALLAEAFDLHAAAGDDLAVAHNRSLLGQLRLRLGDYPGAEKLQREVLEVRSRELSPDHPRITLSLNDLALTLQAAGQLEPAEALFREVLERQQRAFGDRSHHVALATHNLATVLTYDRQTDKALELYAANAERIAEIYGPDHPAAARNAKAKGMAYQVAGQPAEAIVWVRRSRDIYRYHYGPTHGLTLRDANSLVSLMAKTGDPGAEAAYLELIETLRQNLDPKDWRLSYPLLDLGLLRIKNGEARRAEAVMREALALRRAALPESHWEIALAEGHLGFCLLRLGRLDDAAPLLESSEKGLLQLGEDHAKVETARRRLDELEKARAAS